jgi:mitochondrial GTPase 1
VLFTDHKDKSSVGKLLSYAKKHVPASTLTGARMMVVGMPNVGKSSLLNALRKLGMKNNTKAASTGAQPGVTRKIGTGVKIVEGVEGGIEGGVYLLDTPGVFIPYVPSAPSMLKLALTGAVKDTVIPPTTLADYLLFHMNQIEIPDPKNSKREGNTVPGYTLYAQYSPPTNSVDELLSAIAQKTGRLIKAGTGGGGGVPDLDASALWMIQRWRQGHLGRFVLDEVHPGALEERIIEEESMGSSLNQGRKREREARQQRGMLKRGGDQTL